MRSTLLTFSLVACLFGGSAEAAPILLGQTVQTTYLFPTTSTIFAGPTNSVVGPFVELPNFANLADVDFSDTNIRITLTRNANVNNVAFDGFRFFDIFGTIPNNVNAVLNPSTTYAGFMPSRLAGGDQDTLFVNLANLPGLTGQFISIDLVLTTTPTVPEPATLTLLAGGLATLVARRRHSKRRV